MNKRYQVFVSSTYTDLVQERAEVMQALLELDCMPAGMELFPAANEEQWNWIKRVIDESDYYIVLIGGRYGSISDGTGFSYTEMEYRYAIEIGLPVIAFLHENAAKIESGKTEAIPSSKKKLEQFRALTQKKLCKYWSNSTDLGAKVSRSITQLIKHQPAAGWIRADRFDEIESLEINRLRERITELETLRAAETTMVQTDLVDLARGEDVVDIEYSYETKKSVINESGRTYLVKGIEDEGKLQLSWNKLFAILSPNLIEPQHEYAVVEKLNSVINAKSVKDIDEAHPGHKIIKVRIYSNSFDLVKIQFRALGLIFIANDQWSLTTAGDAHMYSLLAKRKHAQEKSS